jgi:hypothetical protein
MFTVSKDSRGQFTTIQAAINEAGIGDTVKILNNAVFAEQVTIDAAHNGLILTSADPLSPAKPTIRWWDTIHTHPHSLAEALDTAMIDYDRNGALRLIGARDVTIDGITIDGGGAYLFGYSVWQNAQGQIFPNQAGNAAVVIWRSAGITIRNCDIANAYFGINTRDCNEGGIFANPDPRDTVQSSVAPLSGFGRAGNHLIESNRIHNNSFGLYFEAMWDLGSVVRYNLLYENHHATPALATQVKKLTTDGSAQPGSAIFFKDHSVSPLAIYNNTFWHNFLIIAGNWRAGVQHLIFNNIYATPYIYWGKEPNWGAGEPYPLDIKFGSRMKNCIYAAQIQAVAAQPYYVGIMNGMELQNVGGPLPPGTLITTPFPAEADIRWFEMPFVSTDPTDPDFLTPVWADTTVQKFIVDQGWPAAGIRDADGSIADLGAIPSGGKISDIIIIKPVTPVAINGTTATFSFTIAIQSGKCTNPIVKYLRFVKNVKFQNFWGNSVLPIPAADILDIPIPATPLSLTSVNTFTVAVPARAATELYAFFELIVEGTGSSGQTVSSTVGFMPYRRLDYSLTITPTNIKGDTISSVTVGDTVVLVFEARKNDGTRFTNPIAPVDVNLSSGNILQDSTRQNPFSLPGGITNGVARTMAVFTAVPPGNSLEYIQATGMWHSSVDPTQMLVLFGTSNGIVILPKKDTTIVRGRIVPQNADQVVTMTLYTLSGRRILTRTFDATALKDLPALQTGLAANVYLMRISAHGKGASTTISRIQRFVVR